MALDSDIQGADAHLMVRFYEKEYGPNKGQDFIEIMIPGNQTLIIDKQADINNGSYKKRFPHHWLRYQMAKNGDFTMSGTRLEEWLKESPDDINPDQLAELQIFKFQTVEQVAGASDLAIQRIGMGGEGLRVRAQMYLKRKNKAAANTELQTTRDELAELKKQMAQLISAQAAGRAAPAKTRRGPKPGWKKAIVDVQHTPATGSAGNE